MDLERMKLLNIEKYRRYRILNVDTCCVNYFVALPLRRSQKTELKYEKYQTCKT